MDLIKYTRTLMMINDSDEEQLELLDMHVSQNKHLSARSRLNAFWLMQLTHANAKADAASDLLSDGSDEEWAAFFSNRVYPVIKENHLPQELS